MLYTVISKPDIAAVLEYYGVNVVSRHGWQPCKCVVHEDSHASAAYNLEKQAYNCLVCNLLGDVYDLVSRKEDIKEFQDVKRRAEKIANGVSAKVSRSTNATGSLLPSGTRNNKGSGGYIPSWKRRGA